MGLETLAVTKLAPKASRTQHKVPNLSGIVFQGSHRFYTGEHKETHSWTFLKNSSSRVLALFLDADDRGMSDVAGPVGAQSFDLQLSSKAPPDLACLIWLLRLLHDSRVKRTTKSRAKQFATSSAGDGRFINSTSNMFHGIQPQKAANQSTNH